MKTYDDWMALAFRIMVESPPRRTVVLSTEEVVDLGAVQDPGGDDVLLDARRWTNQLVEQSGIRPDYLLFGFPLTKGAHGQWNWDVSW
jgi:hypothetical protein